MTNSRTMRVLQAAASMLVLAAVWQIFSLFFPHFLFPPVSEILSRTVNILITGSLLADVLLTAARIFGGLFGAFILGSLLAMVIGQSRTAENFIAPVLTFFQGIPALSWVVFAIIWFHGTEFRVLFIMVMTTLPAFTFQILDAFRSMSKDLFEMTMAFRPSRWTLFRFLIVPTIVPGILTAWKVNLGNAARVVVVAPATNCCASNSCSTWPAPWPGRCSSCCSCWWCSRPSTPSRPGPCATARCPSGRCNVRARY
jgi:ABC-type nitrate/sulfonate/bicarbonate transport system permease component